MKRNLTPIIIFSVCLLAFGPLFAGFFGPEWRANWMLAWAANEYQNGNPEKAESTLKRASELSSKLATETEFWKLRFDFVFNKEKADTKAIQELYEDSVSQISRVPKLQQSIVASFVGTLFNLRGQNDLAVQIMETFYGPVSQRTSVENNTLAYFRSLMGKNLDIALAEIDAALIADGSSREEYLDTKAWVLHGLDRDGEALGFAEAAIKKLNVRLKRFPNVPSKDWSEIHALLFEEAPVEADSDPISSVADVTKTVALASPLDQIKKKLPNVNPLELDELARRIAAMRFHRAQILDGIGRSQQSHFDYDWLVRFGFTETDRLN